jgi:hypothetical protein
VTRHSGTRTVRQRALRRIGIEMNDGTIGGVHDGGGTRNGLPEGKPYRWRGTPALEDAARLEAITRARLAGSRRANLEAALWRVVPAAPGRRASLETARAVDDILTEADTYAAAVVHAASAYAIGELTAAALAGQWKPCHCLCGVSHPDETGLCQALNATVTRTVLDREVPVCAPCYEATEETLR